MYSSDNYSNKQINIKGFLELVKPGFRIFLSSGPAIPGLTAQALIDSTSLNNYDLEIIQLFTLGQYFKKESCGESTYRLKNFKTGESKGEDLCQGRTDYIPANIIEIPYIFATEALEIDMAVITLSPPDSRGYMSLGVAIDVAKLVIQKAKIVVAEVNPNMPVTYGETSIHVDQVDYILESDIPLLERERKPYTAVEDRIGWHISNLIEDSSTVVLHAGRIFDATAANLKGKKNLGIYTNVVSDWVIDLIENGNISIDRPRENGGQVSTSYCYGTRKLYDYVDRNQIFGFYPIAKLAYPPSTRRISRFVSIMNVQKMDITAGMVVFHTGDDLLSGYESKFNFAVGSAISGSGKVIFALRSTDKNGASNIVISHDKENERLRSTFGVVRYVVTEYGVANLFGKSIRERAIALIDIAHPKHRESLLSEAKKCGILFPDQIYDSKKAVNYPVELETVKSFKGYLDLKVRPIKPSDEDMMRRLFYTFSDEAKYLRYFSSVKTMPHKNMQRYVSVDYNRIMSIVALLQHGHNERIVAEARYAAYPDGDNYDMAFLVDEDFQGRGIATFMLNYLFDIAKKRGIEKLSASVLSQNEKMQKVFFKAPVKPVTSVDSGTMEFEFDVSGHEGDSE